LLNEFVDRCARQGAMILRGQGVDQAARHPFQVLDGVSDDLERVIAGEPETADRLRKDLGSWREALTDALPRLAEVLQIEPGHGAAPLSEVRPGSALEREAFGELRNLRALTALLDALGRQERPALVLLDDCQWADELTLKLLRHWQTRPGEGPGQGRPAGCGQHVCIVAAFRSEEVAGRHLLRIMEPSAHLSLSPLLEEDLRTLAESMAGPLPDEAVALVCRLAEGSPFMASAVLRGLVEAGALVPAPSGWQVEPRAMADVQSSRQAAALLARRLGLLAPEIVHLLGVGAVLGKEFDIAFALDLAGQAPQQALPALTEARRRHLVWADREGGRYTFAHDKLREAVLALLPAAERRDLHLRAALRLEEQSARGPSVFELAYHFDAAGACDRALPYALAAAEQARAQHALAIAEQQYRIAERGAHAAEPAVRRRVAEGLGDVLMLRGHYAEAERRFQTALDLADTKVGRAQVGGKLGELALKRGDVRTACVALEQALRLLGRQVPSTRPGLLIRLLWEGSVQALHTFFPRVFLARRPLAGADEEMLAVRLYTRLAYAYWFGRGAVPALWTHLRGMNLAERYPPTPELAHSYSEHAPAMTVLPFLSRGMVYAEKSLAMRRAFSDLWGQGQSLHFHGVVLYAASRFRECIDRCREAIRILERMGDQWEINTARWHIAFCLYRLGDLAGAVEEARRAYQAAVAIGDHQAAGISLGVWSKASGGRVPASLLRAALDGPLDDVHTAAEVLMADGVRLLHEDRPAEAVAQLEEAWRRVHDGGMRQEYVSPVLPWLATALRAELAATPAWAADRRRALLRRSRAVVRRGLRVARWYRNNLPHALREAGYLAAASGRSARARRCFEESLAVAEEQEARAEAALTLQARGEVGMSLGWPGADEDLAAARKELGPLEESLREVVGERPAERTPTLSQADRFDQVLDAGRRIASALTQETIFATVQEAVQVLLRGEHCLVVQFDDSGKQWTPVYGALPSGFSRATAERAVASGRPVLFEAGSSGDVGESMVLAGIRAALYAPFFVRGRAGGCFCVLHRQVGGLFGADEERLAAFIAAVAGAALENAEGFAQLQRLNETLEERVAERTATAEERAYQLARANAELQEVLASVKSLRGLLPICAACKMIRDDQGYWHQVELYIKAHSDADFSHGICPGCAQKLYPDYFPTAEDEADCSTR
jgi:tetratricopeptide (TPR) repeat protein